MLVTPSPTFLNPDWFIGTYLPCGWNRLMKIYSAFPDIKYRTLLEPFAGTARISLNHPTFKDQSRLKIAINDIRTLFSAITKSIINNSKEFYTNSTFMLSVQDFHKQLANNFHTFKKLDSWKYALVSMYISHNSIIENHKEIKDQWKIPELIQYKQRVPQFNLNKLEELRHRLKKIEISNMDYRLFIKKYLDSDDTVDPIMLYLDPPAPTAGKNLKEWEKEFEKEKRFDWWDFYHFIKEIERDRPNLYWLLQSYSPVTSEIFSEYTIKDMGTILYEKYKYPYSFIANYNLPTFLKEDIYNYNGIYDKTKFNSVQFQSDKGIYQFFPKDISAFFQPLTRSYSVARDISIQCDCLKYSTDNHKDHIPLIVVNDPDTRISSLAGFILENFQNLNQVITNSIQLEDLGANDFIFLEHDSKDIRDVLEKISGVNFRNCTNEYDIKQIIKNIQKITFYNENYIDFISLGLELDIPNVFFYFEPPTSNDFNHQELAHILNTSLVDNIWLVQLNKRSLYSKYYSKFPSNQFNENIIISNDIEYNNLNLGQNVSIQYNIITGL